MNLEHVSIIADGNRRWAKSKEIYSSLAHGIAGNYGHLKELADRSIKEGINTLSLWAFSTENWKRSEGEVREIFDTIERGIDSFIENIPLNPYRILHFGRKDRLPSRLKERIDLLEISTKEKKKFNLVFGIDYGGDDELKRAINKMISEGGNSEDIKSFLDLSFLPDPDLIIRTGGDKRLSGYFPLRSSYSELYFTEKTFPDFSREDLSKAIQNFHTRERRFGR